MKKLNFSQMEVLNGGQTVAANGSSYTNDERLVNVGCQTTWFIASGTLAWVGGLVGAALLPGVGGYIGYAVTSALIIAVSSSETDPPCK